MMLLHTSVSMDSLNESNHGLVAHRIEAFVVAGMKALEFINSVSNWILTYAVFDIVPEVCDKSLSVVKLHSESLIINGTPGTIKRFAVTLALRRAFLGLSLEIIKKLCSVNNFILELKMLL